jgi:hypothetical protein
MIFLTFDIDRAKPVADFVPGYPGVFPTRFTFDVSKV